MGLTSSLNDLTLSSDAADKSPSGSDDGDDGDSDAAEKSPSDSEDSFWDEEPSNSDPENDLLVARAQAFLEGGGLASDLDDDDLLLKQCSARDPGTSKLAWARGMAEEIVERERRDKEMKEMDEFLRKTGGDDALLARELEERDKADAAFWDPQQPEAQVKDLMWAAGGKLPADYDALRAKQGRPAVERSWLYHENEEHQLCWACGWTERLQIHSSYSPRVKVFHARENMGMWNLAGK